MHTCKTQALHVTFSDKLIRLQNELTTAFEITNEVVTRGTFKKKTQLYREVWNQCTIFSNLKRKFPTLSTKDDEELLVNKPFHLSIHHKHQQIEF